MWSGFRLSRPYINKSRVARNRAISAHQRLNVVQICAGTQSIPADGVLAQLPHPDRVLSLGRVFDWILVPIQQDHFK